MSPLERRAAAIIRMWIDNPDFPRPFKLELWGDEPSDAVKVIAAVLIHERNEIAALARQAAEATFTGTRDMYEAAENQRAHDALMAFADAIQRGDDESA
jgi:hypothetical protein